MRYKKSIQPNELNRVYYPNQTFSITLPRKKLDLNSFTLHYSANASIAEHIRAHNITRIIDFPTQTAGNPPTSLVDTTTNVLTIVGHGMGALGTYVNVVYKSNGNPVIPGLVNNTRYIVRVMTNNTLRFYNSSTASTFSTTPAALITLGNTATGNHTLELLSIEYKSNARHFPRLSSCVLSDVIVSVGNKQIQHIAEYNTLQAILNDIQKENDNVDGTNIDTTQLVSLSGTPYLAKTSKLLPQSRGASSVGKYLDENKRSYFVPNFLGFLGESSRYFDATDKDVKITFKLAPANILYKGLPSDDYISYKQTVSQTDLTTYEYPPDYELYDIKATVDVLDEIPAIDTFVFRDYLLQQGSYLANNKKCNVSLSLEKPVEYVLSTFKQPDYLTSDTELQLMHCNTDTLKFGEKIKTTLTIGDINSLIPKANAYSYEMSKLLQDPYVLNSSYWFSHQGDGILYTKYKWNGFDLTPQMDMVMCYNETRKCFNTDFKKVPSIQSFEADFFANAIRIDDNTNEYKQIDWEVEIDSSKSNTKGGQPMLFCCYTNKL
jgi:hypothetical protein